MQRDVEQKLADSKVTEEDENVESGTEVKKPPKIPSLKSKIY